MLTAAIRSIIAILAACLLIAALGCASAIPAMTLDEFERSGPVSADEWSLFIAFKGGDTSGNSGWILRVDSSGEAWTRMRHWDRDRTEWWQEDGEATISGPDLARLADVVEVLASAALPARIEALVSHASSVKIACWTGSQYHTVSARGLESVIDPPSRGIVPSQDPERLRGAAHVCLVLANVLQVWSSPNDWQTTEHYAGWAERAVAALDAQR